MEASSTPLICRLPDSRRVKSDDKKRARLNCLRHFLSSLDYPNKDASLVFGADPLIVGSTRHVVGPSHHILGKALHPDERPGAKP